MDDHAPASGHATTAWAAFAGCSLIWGSTFLVISIGNDALPPLWAVALRLALAAALQAAIVAALGQRFPRGAALGAAAGYGFLNMGLSMTLLYWAELSVPSGLVAVLYGSIPLSTALFARAVGLERLVPLKVAGAVVALAGVTSIVAGRFAGTLEVLPVLAAVVAATCAAASGVVLKRGPRQAPLPANAVASAVGAVVAVTASLLAGEPHPLPRTAASLGPVLYLAVAGSLGAFGLYAWLVNHWPVTRISFISVVVPVVALSLGVAFRGERLGRPEVLGAGLVMLGLALALASDRLRPLAAPRP
ncbi:MAG: EamA family transporter [Deltaproteobacteria bacterium]|nr:EamA family transporter [Deltaproteobacteria bacterium]